MEITKIVDWFNRLFFGDPLTEEEFCSRAEKLIKLLRLKGHKRLVDGVEFLVWYYPPKRLLVYSEKGWRGFEQVIVKEGSREVFKFNGPERFYRATTWWHFIQFCI